MQKASIFVAAALLLLFTARLTQRVSADDPPKMLLHALMARQQQLLAWIDAFLSANTALVDTRVPTINLRQMVDEPLLAEFYSVVDWLLGWSRDNAELRVNRRRALNLLCLFVVMQCGVAHSAKIDVLEEQYPGAVNWHSYVYPLRLGRNQLVERVQAQTLAPLLALAQRRLYRLGIRVEHSDQRPFFLRLRNARFARFYRQPQNPSDKAPPLASVMSLEIPRSMDEFRCVARPISARPLFNYANEIVLFHRAQCFVGAHTFFERVSEFNILHSLTLMAYIEFLRIEFRIHECNPYRQVFTASLTPELRQADAETRANIAQLVKVYNQLVVQVGRYYQRDAARRRQWERCEAQMTPVFQLSDGGRRVALTLAEPVGPLDFVDHEMADGMSMAKCTSTSATATFNDTTDSCTAATDSGRNITNMRFESLDNSSHSNRHHAHHIELRSVELSELDLESTTVVISNDSLLTPAINNAKKAASSAAAAATSAKTAALRATMTSLDATKTACELTANILTAIRPPLSALAIAERTQIAAANATAAAARAVQASIRTDILATEAASNAARLSRLTLVDAFKVAKIAALVSKAEKAAKREKRRAAKAAASARKAARRVRRAVDIVGHYLSTVTKSG